MNKEIENHPTVINARAEIAAKYKELRGTIKYMEQAQQC